MRLCVLLFVVYGVSGNSVHYTNSNNHFAKSKYEEFTSYHLDVPGSTDSITIIESKDHGKPSDESARDMQSGESKRQIVYAPSLLSKYIEEYNRKKNTDFGEDSRSSEEDARSYGRPQLPSPPQKNPYRENEGWVTLEAVPWSKSKVSIWKANSKPIGESLENHSLENESILGYGLSTHFTHQKKPQKGYLPPKSHTYLSRYPDEIVKEKEGIITAPPIDRFYEYGSNANDRSDSAYSHSLGYPGEIMNKEFQSQPIKLRPPAVGNYRDHSLPSSYPENGNGEWVLVSTTKGYQKDRNSHKKVDHSPKEYQNQQKKSPTSYRMHKALKLTVLPPKDKTTKMVLSHNGLIEVAESTNPISSDTIEASVASALKNKKKKRQTNNQEIKIVKAVPVSHSTYDKSTVLAAVTAGMVPASIAMMVPLLGKK